MSNTVSPLRSPAPSTPPRTFNSEDSKCNICQEEFDTGDEPEIPLTLSCGHVLGSVCLSRWLHVPGRTHGCPMCRKKLFRAQEEAQAHHQPATGSPASLNDELSAEMRRVFGSYRSTDAVIEMHRSQASTRNPAVVIESVLHDHRHRFNTLSHYRASQREATTRLYNHIEAALSHTSTWLQTRPAFNANACAQLQHHWRLSLINTANDFRSQDKRTLINLLKAGVFTAPGMQDTAFDIRLLITNNLSTETLPFGEGANPAAAHTHRILRAMPNITAAYEEINIAERLRPWRIAEYDFRALWEADMAIRGPRSVESTGRASGGDEEMRGVGEEDEMTAITRAVDRTLVAATSLLGPRPGEVGQGDETDVVGNEQAATTGGNEASSLHAATEPRRGRGGRRGRGRGRGQERRGGDC